MNSFIEHELTDSVVARFGASDNPRLRRVMTSLVKHLHDFVRENEITSEEWRMGIDFLTRVGQMCDDRRQEFILLSDVVGVSMLVDAMNHVPNGDSTESAVLGPFYVENSPEMPMGASIAGEDTGGEPVLMRGRVTDTEGNPIEGALLDIWETAPNGLYDIQEPEKGTNMRGRFRTGPDGSYRFRTARPVSYPIPHDGPVGDLIAASGSHPFRPAHIHFIITADGFEPLTTQLYSAGDPYIDSDAVYGVKQSLIVDYTPGEDGLLQAQYDFVLRTK